MFQPDGSSDPPHLSHSDPTTGTPLTPSSTHSFIERPHISGYMVQQRSTSRKPARPSTAPPSARKDLGLLPSIPPGLAYSPRAPSTSVVPFGNQADVNRKDGVRPMQTLVEDDIDSPGSLSLETFPTVESLLGSESPTDSTGEKATISSTSDYDWATFISAYAAGRWDPHRTPNPPRSCQQVIVESHRFSTYEPPAKTSVVGTSREPSIVAQKPIQDTNLNSPTPPTRIDDRSPLMSPFPPSLTATSINSTSSITSHPPMSLRLPWPTHRLRNSFPASLPNSSTHISHSSVSDVHATVATMRWAAARVDISPLALPSPECELTDPMRGVTATVPGSHPENTDIRVDYTITPGGTRRSKLNGFWEGTIDVDKSDSTSLMQLETIGHERSETLVTMETAEPNQSNDKTSGTPQTVPGSSSSDETPRAHSDHSVQFALLKSAPPATAPALRVHHQDSTLNTDYFGNLSPQHSEARSRETSSALTSPPPVLLRNEDSMPEIGTVSVPALPRRLCLTRQTSSPLPESAPPEPRFLSGRVPTESITSVKLGRAAKEERMFADLEYLAPPYPPDELERRRALYKFNIWNTGPDMNFDRIAHLAKLVFSTKGVIISLIDSNEQWFKSEWGLKTPSCARAHSFCGHAILQRGDEPMVILDSYKDWRFKKNPLTIGPPYIRFFAGAPLRTQGGFNIGALSVIDDQPREDFSPRQRHTLKEFAAIAMREMELWKDKIQLRIRDRIQNSMEQFSRECLEIDTEIHDGFEQPDLLVGSSMDRVYDRAAKLVKRTLDVEGVIVMDVSHCEVLESMSAEGSVSVTMHHGDPGMEMTKRQLTTDEYHKLNSFFEKYPDGRISEGIIPPSFKPFLPIHVQYALTVPIFNIDKRPFALLCAYNTHDHAKRFLEGHELSYLRAIGVIILSAVLKRRMILADKAKGLFISNISHELRTPLHGILAAAELLSDSSLNHSQQSFLQTVQACGTSLVETVNHVLDFTKLSGNSKAGGVENVIVPTAVDLMQLVEEAIDGCWIGHRARTAIMDDSGIGSVYSPPKEDHGSPVATRRKHVETIVDIGYRPEGWTLKCEKGGIRRVLMNLFGNSLKFTSDGYVHVLLRQLPASEDDPPNKVKVELAVFDTGKGISQNFLKNQLFHPFSQENPLQTGTGLGLAIVSSIVTSENVGGKVDVWSEEGVGTEIKVTFPAEISAETAHKTIAREMESFKADQSDQLPTVSLMGFSGPHKGVQLLNNALRAYLTTWWGFQIVDEGGDIIIVNDDTGPVVAATERWDTNRAYIILSAARGNPMIMSIASEHERIGGFCRILYKPGGPSRLRVILKLSVHALRIGKSRVPSPMGTMYSDSAQASVDGKDRSVSGSSIPRRNSEEASIRSRAHVGRPPMTPRSSTANPAPAKWGLLRAVESDEIPDPDTSVPTISLGPGGTLLKSSVGSLEQGSRFRVLVVEDNAILRNLLTKWLSNKGYEFFSAVDGRDGVNVFEKEGPFDVVLLDLSMPVLDGVGATTEIRRIEAEMIENSNEIRRSRILALTGMSSLENKRRAFEAGVDGYLVKPVAFKTLDDMFHKLGVS
ncbi:hypothetical protein GALMADRAFT_224162 [Galerina marginata CBS 339.88]|uniref:histidine kinase n=1 Tax=Galerina marginata (strain CBS 339.88) TaxID=685588 RepID=A0A067T6W0_GALM3|nr:hypothetical protein GALMADRAFT_224162 [Galerina marginata CBS 339.88]